MCLDPIKHPSVCHYYNKRPKTGYLEEGLSSLLLWRFIVQDWMTSLDDLSGVDILDGGVLGWCRASQSKMRLLGCLLTEPS